MAVPITYLDTSKNSHRFFNLQSQILIDYIIELQIESPFK